MVKKEFTEKIIKNERKRFFYINYKKNIIKVKKKGTV